ncbi:MAG: hypothetical protein EP307_14375 [Rhodobacteraceae bacterium]|nr:MAG: hypothetical protein EP307_14375 [Paracoccaceae bacterium]
MQCPIDGTSLVIADRSGVEIDYCPKCRGVWLDRGELDKIIDRSLSDMAPPAAAPRGRDDGYRGGDHRDDRKRKSRGSFLGELFDF